LGIVVPFPKWRVITRDEGYAPGEPRLLIDPHGHVVQVEAVLRRRLVATSEPGEPVCYESLIRAGGEKFILRHFEGQDGWHVDPV
jgi:hypothetical protein